MKVLFAFSLVLIASTVCFSQKAFDIIAKNDVKALAKFMEKKYNANEAWMTKAGEFDGKPIQHDFSLIEWAANKDCLPCLQELEKHEAKFKGTFDLDEEYSKCLSHAVNKHNDEMVDFLLTKNVDVNYKCETCHGQTPIQIALNYYSYYGFFKLLERGADPHVKNIAGFNLFHSFLSNFENVYYRIGGKIVDGKDVAFIIIDTLKNRGIDIYEKSNDSIPAWMFSLSTNQPEIYERVVGDQRLLDWKNRKLIATGLLLSMSIMVEGNLAPNNNMFEYFIKKEWLNLDSGLVNTKPYFENSLITEACSFNNMIAFKQLIYYKPDLEVIDSDGLKCLDHAIYYKNNEMCDVLIQYGAKVTAEQLKLAKKAFKDDYSLTSNMQDVFDQSK